MVSNSRTTGKSTYNCYCYDGNTCYQRHYTVLDKKKVKILSFQAYLICVIKFKTPKNPVHGSGRDFTYYFLPLHSYLKIKFTRDFWEVISNKNLTHHHN